MTTEHESPSPELVAAVERAVALTDPEHRLVGFWLNPPLVPAMPRVRAIRAAYALPASRFAGLRHWRDEWEGWLAGAGVDGAEDPYSTMSPDGVETHIVAMEVSKLARLLLDPHAGTLAVAATAAAWDPAGSLAELGAIATQCWTPEARVWAELAGLEVPPHAVSLAAPERFERLEAWLQGVRCARVGKTY